MGILDLSPETLKSISQISSGLSTAGVLMPNPLLPNVPSFSTWLLAASPLLAPKKNLGSSLKEIAGLSSSLTGLQACFPGMLPSLGMLNMNGLVGNISSLEETFKEVAGMLSKKETLLPGLLTLPFDAYYFTRRAERAVHHFSHIPQSIELDAGFAKMNLPALLSCAMSPNR